MNNENRKAMKRLSISDLNVNPISSEYDLSKGQRGKYGRKGIDLDPVATALKIESTKPEIEFDECTYPQCS